MCGHYFIESGGLSLCRWNHVFELVGVHYILDYRNKFTKDNKQFI